MGVPTPARVGAVFFLWSATAGAAEAEAGRVVHRGCWLGLPRGGWLGWSCRHRHAWWRFARAAERREFLGAGGAVCTPWWLRALLLCTHYTHLSTLPFATVRRVGTG